MAPQKQNEDGKVGFDIPMLQEFISKHIPEFLGRQKNKWELTYENAMEIESMWAELQFERIPRVSAVKPNST